MKVAQLRDGESIESSGKTAQGDFQPRQHRAFGLDKGYIRTQSDRASCGQSQTAKKGSTIHSRTNYLAL
jgi:hypothetical protein